MALPGDTSFLPKTLRDNLRAQISSPFTEDHGNDTARTAWQRPSERVLYSASIPFDGMAINTGLAGRAESLEQPAERQLHWGKKSPRCKRSCSGGSGDPVEAFPELRGNDEEHLIQPEEQQAGMGPTAHSSAFAELQTDVQQQEQLQEDQGSWAALGALDGAEGQPHSSAGRLPHPSDFRLSSDHQQQQEGSSDGGQADSAEPRDSGGAEDGGGDEDDALGWQSNSKTCCMCDNGGQILYCDGPCYRAFHYGVEPRYVRRDTGEDAVDATQESEEVEYRSVYREHHCNPLRMDEELVDYLCGGDTTFECPNCLALEHQCFHCKREGKEGVDVFKCSFLSCGRHYHKHCLAEDFARCKEQAVEKEIWEQNAFICPQHTCEVCQQGDDASDKGQLIPCARCPVAYHLLCLPQPILDSKTCRVWLNNEERDRWGEGNELFQRTSIEKNGGVEDCILYCDHHPIAPESDNPERPRPLISDRLLEAWEIHMADEHRSLAWSQEFRRRRQEAERQRAEAERRRQAEAAAARQHAQHERERQQKLKLKLKRKLKLKQLQQQQQQGNPAAAKRKLEPSAGAPKRKAEPSGPPKPKRLVKKSALEQAPPARDGSSDELDDLPLAKRVRRDAAGQSRSSSAAAAPAGREPKQKPKAAGRGAASSKAPPASPTFSDLDSSPVPKVPKKRIPASEKPPAAALLSSPRRAAPAQQPAQAGQLGGPAQSQQEPVPRAAPPSIVTVVVPEPESRQGTPVTDAEPDQAEAGEDVEALMATYFGSDDEEGPPEFIGLEALPPPEAALEAAEEPEERLQPCEMIEHWAVETMAARLAAMLGKAKGRNLIERMDVLTPRPFDRCTTATIPQTRLEEMAKTVKMQQIMDRNRANASNLLTLDNVKQMSMYQDRMQTFLAPFLHRDRYTSYGRHFTQDQHLHVLNEFLLPHIHNGDTVVDFSCGANVWVPMLKNMCLEAGIEIKGICYDIITPRCMEDFRHDTWYDVKEGDLPDGNQLIIGLNPPFGKNGSLAAEFARLAAKHRPRLIVLIVPPATPIPDGYTSIKEETSLMAGEAFFVPGSTERSWNATTPSTRILVRNDLHQQVLDMVGMQCIAHHSFEPRMQPGMGTGMGMGMPMQMHLPMVADYPPAHPMYSETVMAGYPVMPIMHLPY